jgi:hypothetical protein
MLLLLAALLAAVRRPRKHAGAPPVRRVALAPAAFVILACCGYGLWFGWYAQLEIDDRFMMVLWLPLLWSLLRGAEKLVSLARTAAPARWIAPAWQGLVWASNLAVALQIYQVLLTLM